MITVDPRNYNKHTERGSKMLNDSLSELGAGRSIVVDKNNVIIAGSSTYTEAKKLGIRIRIIDTDGTELLVNKRTDLATDDIKRQQLAVLDNKTSSESSLDVELLTVDWDDLHLEGFDLDLSDFAVGITDLESAGEEDDDGSNKNKEIDIDMMDTSECKIVFKFDAIMYESIMQRLNTIKSEEEIQTNEAVLLKLLECYGR